MPYLISHQRRAAPGIPTSRTRRERRRAAPDLVEVRSVHRGRRTTKRANSPLRPSGRPGLCRQGPTPGDPGRGPSGLVESGKLRQTRRAVHDAPSAQQQRATGSERPLLKSRRARQARVCGLHAKRSRRRRQATLGVMGREGRHDAPARSKRQGVPVRHARPRGESFKDALAQEAPASCKQLTPPHGTSPTGNAIARRNLAPAARIRK